MRIDESTQVMQRPPSGRIVGIDVLRGGAALAVVVHHAVTYGEWRQFSQAWFQWLLRVLSFGHLGVPLFFVISGFCIHQRWLRDAKVQGDVATVDVRGFWRRRLWRLYPPYFTALVLSLLTVSVAYSLGVQTPAMEVYRQRGISALFEDFIFHATMLHGLHPLYDKAAGNGPLWTIAREEYLYLLYIPALWARRSWGLLRVSWGIAVVSVSTAVAVVAFIGAESVFYGVARSSAFALWIQWWFGVISAEASDGRFRLHVVLRSWWSVPVFFALAVAVERLAPVLSAVAWGLVFFVVVNSAVRGSQEDVLAVRPALVRAFASMGLVSYSVYLVHDPVRAVFKRVLGVFWTADGPVLYLLDSIIIVVMGVVAGVVFYWLVERHFASGGALVRSENGRVVHPIETQL